MMNKVNEVKLFYNDFKEKLSEDFFKPNDRMANAIQLAISKIPIQTKSILDLGFGLGWSSFEFARHFPNAMVEGYDISDVLTTTASALFNSHNLSFSAMDLTSTFPDGAYDVVVLLDVFEHIPLVERDNFFANIKSVLSHQGRVIMTCPTTYHQEYLRKNKPEGLQPVDEDVDLTTIGEFAKNTNTTISHFQLLTIWNKHDYLFAVIENEVDFHTKKALQYVKQPQLLTFKEKYALALKADKGCIALPTLTLRQKIKYYFI
jgi:cyclopropane fatty-acyl-phospholipid synthase-like methyltransferase